MQSPAQTKTPPDFSGGVRHLPVFCTRHDSLVQFLDRPRMTRHLSGRNDPQSQIAIPSPASLRVELPGMSGEEQESSPEEAYRLVLVYQDGMESERIIWLAPNLVEFFVPILMRTKLFREVRLAPDDQRIP
jgi:hypothetical protein